MFRTSEFHYFQHPLKLIKRQVFFCFIIAEVSLVISEKLCEKHMIFCCQVSTKTKIIYFSLRFETGNFFLQIEDILESKVFII